jgi:uncharacterized ion transporter superfamily protein YfcC
MAQQKKFPDTLLILMSILLVFVILTWIIPAGTFDRVEMNGRQVVVPDSYERIEASPQGVGAFLMAPIKGFIGAAQIIAFVFLIGGAFAMINKTGAMDAGIHAVLESSRKNKQIKRWSIPLLMTMFSLGGATFGMSEEVLVFVMITIPLGIALGYDSIVGVAISFVGAGAGFAGAFLNPFTVGVAQGIAELPPFSGMSYRILAWVIMTIGAIIFVMRYARKIEKNPESSPVFELDAQRDDPIVNGKGLDFTRRHKWVLWLLLLSLVVLVFGVSEWGWYINEITGLFMALGILAALIGGISMDDSVSSFKQGAKDMMVPALVIALAKGLIVVAEDGRIIDTMLNSLASMANGLPKGLSVEMMFIFQSLLNFFIPSGSGQAALTMPIMAPLSDLLGVSRQVAVLAFQFGDGLSNLIIPTSGVTMGILAIAKIPYNVWFKWMLPLFLILSGLGMIYLFFAAMYIH